jgi:hypothetical protein
MEYIRCAFGKLKNKPCILPWNTTTFYLGTCQTRYSNPCLGLFSSRGFQENDAHRFQDIQQMKVVRLSALSTSRLYPKGNILVEYVLISSPKLLKTRLCNENQPDALFVLNLFRQSSSTCFGHVCCPSLGGIHYICTATGQLKRKGYVNGKFDNIIGNRNHSLLACGTKT